mmetsp:Transcript_48374/g.121904  ORF Transcript_48374/g.121904 Transcript_48374/m.121904 type:complete len:312 (-) Transcript_48374:2369-3304(-)
MLPRGARDFLGDVVRDRLDLPQPDGVPAAELRDPVAQLRREGRQVAGFDRVLEGWQDLTPQIHQLLEPSARRALVDESVPLVETDLALLLIDHDCIGKEEHKGRENQRGVHDLGLVPSHFHGIAEHHPLITILAVHLVLPVRGAPERQDLGVTIEPPIRRPLTAVENGDVRGEGSDHGRPDEGILLGALFHWVDLAVVAVSDIRAVVAGVHHETDELLHHHVGHIEGFRGQALLVAELQIVASSRFTAPLDIGLEAREVVRGETLVEVVLPSRLLVGALAVFLSGGGLLEGVLDAEEGSDASRWLDDSEGR